jgi:hypothetical protein
MQQLTECPTTGLMLPRQFVDEKTALKKTIDQYVEKACSEFSHIKGTYFLTLHAKFDRYDPGNFNMAPPTITKKLPPFLSNSFVFWVNNARGICELLWMVAPCKKGQKLKVEFNQKGVAYLQAKGAMPS